MKKRLFAVIFCILLCVSMLPVSAFAESNANVQISEAGVVTWNAFGDTGEYEISVRRYEDGTGLVIDAKNITGTSYDLKTYMDTKKIESGSYHIVVITTQGGHSVNSEYKGYYYQSALSKLAAPQNLCWSGTVAFWNAVSRATEYQVTLRSSSGGTIATKIYTTTCVDFGSQATAGTWFEVIAMADGYRDSSVAESPKFGSSSETREESITGNGGDNWGVTMSPAGVLTWNEQSGAGSYSVELDSYENGAGLVIMKTGITDATFDLKAFLDGRKIDNGSYYIFITADISGGGRTSSQAMRYQYASPLPRLAAPQNLRWDGTEAKWNFVPDATGYTVKLHNSDGTLSKTRTTNANGCRFDDVTEGQWFEVIATASGYRDSGAAESRGYGAALHTITVTGGAACEDASGTKTITEAMPGDVVYLIPNPQPGQSFDGWMVSDLTLFASQSACYFVMPDSNVTVTAQFSGEPISDRYNITVHGGRACTDNAGQNEITYAAPGAKVYLFPNPSEIPADMKFDNGWTVNSPAGLTLSASLPATFTMPTSNVEVTVKLVRDHKGQNDIAYGADETWYLDQAGCLHITGAVVNPCSSADDTTPWAVHKSEILSVVAETGAAIDNGYSLFKNCANLTSVDLRELDTSDVTSMGSMFNGCSSLKDVNLNGIDTAKVTTVFAMFNGCSALETLDLGSLSVAGADSRAMFSGCSSLKTLDIGHFGAPSQANSMFAGCTGLTTLKVSGGVIGQTAGQLKDLGKWRDQDGRVYTSANELKAIAGTVTLTRLIAGDVDADLDIDADDLSVLLRHVAGIEKITDKCALICADLSGDGQVDAADVTALAKKIQG